MPLTPEKIAQEVFFKGVTTEPFLRAWMYVDKEASTLNTLHALFKFTDPAEEEAKPGGNEGVFGFCGDGTAEGDEP